MDVGFLVTYGVVRIVTMWRAGSCYWQIPNYTEGMTMPPIRHIGFTVLILAVGAGAGFLCRWIGTPLPFMLGSLIAAAIAATAFYPRFPDGYVFPMPLRQMCVGVIGVMIGAQVSPELLSLVPTMAVSIPAIFLFIAIAHSLNFLIFRRLGGLDRATAFFSGSPGGLLEAIAFGEEVGADIQRLTILQFLRIIVVVTLLPIAISIYEGEAVGSAAGMSMSLGLSPDVVDIGWTLLFAAIGIQIGTWIKLPAAQLSGPLLIVGAASGLGLISIAIPPWLLASAQVVLGASLGLRFTGMTRQVLVSGVGLSLASVASMLVVGIALAFGVSRLTGADFETLIISFAPGGVTEMSLIALSLAASPAFVTLHHLIRIIATVIELAIVRKTGWLSR